MKRYLTFIVFSTAALVVPTTLLASTNCDSQAKPAFDCPTGYSMMCIPVGGDHWGCGKQNADGTFDEAAGVAPAPDGTAAAAISPSPTAEQTAPAGSPTLTSGAAAASPDPGVSVRQEPALTAAPVPAPETPSATTSSASSGASTLTTPQQGPTGEPENSNNDVNRDSVMPITDTPADGGSQSAAAAESPSLEDLGEAADLLSERAPSALRPVFAAVASTIAAVVALLGIWEWVKRLREKRTKKCVRCGGDKEGTKKGPCATCGGKKTVEKEFEVTVKCSHCGGSGTDPCHHCGGTGKMSMPNPPQSKEELEGWPPCDFCGGSGKKRIGAGRDWGEANDAMKGDVACCFCHGKKEETAKMKREVPCPTCAK